MKIEGKSVTELSSLLERGECTSEELTRAALLQIEKKDASVGAFLTVCAKDAIEAARASDARRKSGERLSLLDGIPYAAKDSFCTKGIPTTAASQMLKGYLPPYDATVISLLRDAGCVLIGKTNMDEFAMGSTTTLSAFGCTKNPLELTRVAGGSSGGSAAAVAMGSVPFALGSDTGGSVRQPAAYCGIMGLKPTYGAISRYGMIAFASSLDCVGLLAHTSEDLALLLSVLACRDEKDATSVGYTGHGLLTSVSAGVKGLRVGVIADGLGEGFEREAFDTVALAADLLCASGACEEQAGLPSASSALMSYYVISSVEAASNLARYDGFRYGACVDARTPDARAAATRGACFGEEVKSRILLGNAMLTGDFREKYYLPACAAREEIRASMYDLFERFDLLLMPTVPRGAHELTESLSPLGEKEADLCTVYASLAGLPALSLPFGKDANGMPLGVQLIAAPMREDLILRAARVLEGRG